MSPDTESAETRRAGGEPLPDGAKPWLHDLGRWIARWLFRPRFSIRVHGLERVPREGGLVVVANHSSMIEPQLLFGLLRRRVVFLVKRELFVPVLGTLLRWIGQLAINRSAPDRAPLLAAVRILRGGGVIGVFPEGTRGSGEVTAAHQGAAWLVRASGASVLPVAVRGTAASASTGLRPRIDVLVGEPVTLTVGKGAAGLAEGTERLRGELADLVRTLDGWRAERETR